MKRDWLLIGVLIALVLPLRLWILHNTEVPARDSITFVQYALQFGDKDWRTVLAENQQHPGYPVLVWLTSLPVCAIAGETTPETLANATQLVSLIAALALIVPMYWLGRQFFGPRVSFGATLLFQYLPVSAHHLSDGVSEAVYLLWIVSGLLSGVRAVRERSLGWCGLCGGFAGLAYLTRPEGIMILAAVGGAATLAQFRAAWRCPWPRFAACAAMVSVTAALVGSPYVVATGRFTNKPTGFHLLGVQNPFEKQAEVRFDRPSILFAATFQRSESKVVRLGQAVKALTFEMAQGLFYVGGILALLGWWWSPGRLKRDPGFWVVVGYGTLHALLLIALAMSAGYVSDRHVMIIVLFACYFAAAAVSELPARLSAWRRVEPGAFAWRTAPALLLLGLIACCLPKATQRLHGNRAANHAAGRWLAEHVDRSDIIDDVYDWSRYYSGQFLNARHDPNHEPTCYIVTTAGTSQPSRDDLVARPRVERRPDAAVAYQWPEGGDVRNARLVVYVQPK